MKKSFIKILIVFSILLPLSLSFGGATIPQNGFTAYSTNGDIQIRWQTITENNVKHFVIERRTQNSDWIEIATLIPEADKYYEFLDQNVFKSNENIYYYRIKIVDKDGVISYTNEIPVLHSTATSVKRTWGSIKALFR